MSNLAPLTTRNTDEPIAFLLKDLPGFHAGKGLVTVTEFLKHVSALAEVLPAHATVINLCDNRYHILVAFCAALVCKQTNLLPPNHKLETQKRLQQQYPDSYIVHDGAQVIEGLPSLDFSSIQIESSCLVQADCPQIALSHLAAISFTSGSTGNSKPNHKSWLTCYESSKINLQHMLPSPGKTYYQLATVPAQHMWGFETSILLPLFANVCLSDGKPLFPLDIQDALKKLPKPNMLVSTPVHLRAMLASEIKYDDVELLMSAAAPLSQTLAQDCEKLFSAELREVYGCSEVGSMAFRRTANTDIWQRFDGIDYKQQHDVTTASGQHLPEHIELQDNIQLLENSQFRLAGRVSDMVNIAGKRGSLHDINQVLLAYKGIVDGQIFLPAAAKQAITRLAAVIVLREGYNLEQVRKYLQAHIDSAFVPRPIKQVDALPRSENGKLPYLQLLEFYNSLT